jgi:MSHA biogenesis protein MshO
MRVDRKFQRGFSLVEMIVVIVITGIIGGVVAMFIRAPVQGYMDSARRAEMTDIADTALRRMARDIRTAVPNSVRIPVAAGSTYIEFLPTKAGGRYRANPAGLGGCGAAGDDLSFTAADTCFEIIGTPIAFVRGATDPTSDQIVVGSTQSDGNAPYQDPTGAACNVPATTTCIRRSVSAAGAGLLARVVVNSLYPLPAFAELPSQHFDVVPNDQQAVTYACVGTLVTLDANNDGQAQLMRYWNYGFNNVQPVPPLAGGAILANRVSNCNIVYNLANQRSGLVAITLGITRGGESVSLYQEIHVNNIP